jgi:hypothetical protein
MKSIIYDQSWSHLSGLNKSFAGLGLKLTDASHKVWYNVFVPVNEVVKQQICNQIIFGFYGLDNPDDLLKGNF